MKVLVCGGRDFGRTTSESVYIEAWLDNVHRDTPITLLIEGGARGADGEAALWATFRGVPVKEVPADWKKHGRAAGPMRNKLMLSMKPDLVVAFPGGRGTAHMVAIATAAGVRVIKL